ACWLTYRYLIYHASLHDALPILTPRDFALINSNTITCPVFRSKADAELTKKIYARIPVLVDESKGREGNPWGVQFATMFHMSNRSEEHTSELQSRENLVCGILLE